MQEGRREHTERGSFYQVFLVYPVFTKVRGGGTMVKYTYEELTFVYVEFSSGNKGFTIFHPQTIINLKSQYPEQCQFNY